MFDGWSDENLLNQSATALISVKEFSLEHTALPRVLLVDDQIQILDALAVHLRDEYQVFTALNGEAALERLQELNGVAVIVSDMRMPGMDGITLLQRVMQRYPQTTRILLTGEPGQVSIAKAINEGHIYRFLTKPCPLSMLRSAIKQGIEQHLLHQQSQHARERVAILEQLVNERTRDLQLVSARLVTAQQELSLTQQLPATARPREPLALEIALKHALATNQLSMHYQPLVDVETRRTVSLEALVRWHHPELGEIPPSRFIPVAEESELILPLGDWILRTVCEQVMRWKNEGIAVVPVAVNISAIQLQRQNLWKVVRRVLRETGLPPELLTLELTESLIVSNAQTHIKHLQGLRRDGIRVSIDDFGTGYSSLSYLKQLPIDVLKIDRSFIRNVDVDVKDATIVKAILTMAHGLGLKVVAEGVETAAQLEMLLSHGCEVAQGYYFSRPLAATDCRQLLVELSKRPAFTETLRIQLLSSMRGQWRGAAVDH